MRALGVAGLGVAMAAGLTACAGPVGIARFNEMMSERARNRATFDFNCASTEVRVVAIDSRNFGAVGCGHRATYVAQPAICNPDNVTEQGVNQYCSVVMNSLSSDGADGPAVGTALPAAPAPVPLTSGCAALPWNGQVGGVVESVVTTALPTAQPGPVADGTYLLSGYEWHVAGDHTASRRNVMHVAGTTIEMAFASGAEAPVTMRGEVRFGADGSMSIAISCPRAGTLEFDRYAVTATGVMLISTAQNKVAVFVRSVSL